MSVRLVKQIEAALREQAESGTPMTRHRAAAHAHVLRRLLDDPAVCKALRFHKKSPKGNKALFAGLCYRIRLELFDGDGVRAAMQTARVWRYTDRSIRTYSSTFKRQIDHWLKKLDANINYQGKTRPQKLRAELQELEAAITLQAKPVKRQHRRVV